MGKPYLIFTDSTCDLPKEIIVEHGIHHLPMPYMLDDTEHLYDLVSYKGYKEYYNAIRGESTTGTSVFDSNYFVEELEKYISQGMDILYICICSQLSDNYKVLLEAKKTLKEMHPLNDLIVIDSRRLSGAMGLMLIKSMELKEKGAALGEIYQWLERYKTGFQGLFMVNDIFHLTHSSEHGESLNNPSAHLGMLIKVKPIMHIDPSGKAAVYDKPIGKKAAIDRLVKVLAEHAYEPEKNTLIICHADCIDDAHELSSKIAKKVFFKDIIITYFGPVIGAHVGADSLGIAYIGEE